MAAPNNTSPSPNKGDTEGREHLDDWLQKNRPLLDIFLDAFCVVDAKNVVVDFNEAFMELTGESYRKVLKIGDFCSLMKTPLCPGECPARQVVSLNKPLRIDELKGETKAFPTLQIILGAVPITSPTGEAVGALLTIRNVTAENELQKKYDERKKESIVDGLTQLYNKSYTEGMLTRTVKAAIRQGASHKLSVVMADIDHFKKVNDTYGHQAGDHVLATVAKILKEDARDTDIVGRFGGEEFVCILPSTDIKGAQIFCERFRKQVEETKIVHEGIHIPVTVSLGTSTSLTTWSLETDPDQAVKELVNRADTALYFAKANGRNRVCQFETLPKADEGVEETTAAPKKPGKKAA